MKVASFHVRATTVQAERWNRASESEGYRATGQWIAAAVDAYLKVRAKAGIPLPLAWRLGRLRVRLEDGTEPEVPGWIARPFAFFHGSPDGPIPHGSTHCYSLVYAGRIIATFRRASHCKALAAELAPVMIRGDPLPAPGAVVERHQREAV